MNPSELAARLRDPGDDAPAARLASLIVGDAMSRPLSELIDPAAAVQAVRDAVIGATATDGASRRLEALLAEAHQALAAVPGPVGTVLPAAVRDAATAAAGLPVVLPREAVLRLLDRPTVRQLLRAQIVRTLSDFGRKAASPVADSTLARGLGGLGKLAGQIARPGPLGAFASAVTGEVERQVEKRAAEFADTAVAGVLAGIAEHVGDPSHASEQAALRRELVEGLLGLEGKELAALLGGDPAAPVRLGRDAARALAEDDALGAAAVALATALVAREGDRPLGDLLAEIGVRGAVEAHAHGLARAALGRLFDGPAFAAWLADAMRPR